MFAGVILQRAILFFETAFISFCEFLASSIQRFCQSSFKYICNRTIEFVISLLHLSPSSSSSFFSLFYSKFNRIQQLVRRGGLKKPPGL